MKALVSYGRNIYPLVLKTFEKPDSGNASLPKPINLILLIISLLGLSIYQCTSSAVYLNSWGNLINNTISSLVFAPNGWLQTIAFYVLSISVLALAILLQFKAPVKLNLGAILIALVGFGLLLIGTCPAQFPGEPFIENIHKWSTIAIISLLPTAGFFLAATFKTWNYRFLYTYTIINSTFQILFICIGGFFLTIDYNMYGLFERVMLVSSQMWLTVIGLNFLLAETQYDLPLISTNRLLSKPALYCLLYVYGSMLWPLSLSIIK